MEPYILPVLLAALLTVSGSYFLFARRALTRAEHNGICTKQAQVTHAQVRGLTADVAEVKKDVRMLVTHLLPKGGGK